MNILDYLYMRGDIEFKDDPFNEVDNLCITEATYTLLEPYIKSINESYTIKEIADIYFKNNSIEDIGKDKSFINRSPLALKAMAESKRFSNCVLHHFMSKIDKSKIEQFCVLQIDLPNNLTYVSFRGTDDTLIGWKEDLKIAYEITKAQEESANYVNTYIDFGKKNILGKYKDKKKYIFGGHSKGGNLAIYAAIKANKDLKDRIIKIYSNDGPGMNKEFVSEEEIINIKDRIELITPSFDLVGTIYDDSNIKHKIIKSDAFAIGQHFGLNWQVQQNHFVYVSNYEPETDVIRNSFNHFMEEVSLEDRKIFVNELFNVVSELKISNLSEITKVKLPSVFNGIRRISKMSEEGKETANKLFMIFTDLFDYEKNNINIMLLNKTKANKEK